MKHLASLFVAALAENQASWSFCLSKQWSQVPRPPGWWGHHVLAGARAKRGLGGSQVEVWFSLPSNPTFLHQTSLQKAYFRVSPVPLPAEGHVGPGLTVSTSPYGLQPSKWKEFPARAQAYHVRGYGWNDKKVQFHLIVPTGHNMCLSVEGLRLPGKVANGRPRPPRWPWVENVKKHRVCPPPMPRFSVTLTIL